jgi:predicted MFS family arabinose efflux permease
VAYGLYNFAWALGLMLGPSIGAAVYERTSFGTVAWIWAPVVLAIALILSRGGALPARRA